LLLGQSAEEVLKKVQTKYNSVEDFSADFKQSTGGNSEREFAGKFFYKKTDKFKISFQNLVIVSNGETIWNFDKRLNRVVINSVENDPSSFSISRIIYDYPEQCSLNLKDKSGELDILVLVPKNSELAFAAAELAVDREGLIRRLEITDKMGNAYLFQMDNIETNKGLRDSIFEFYPPEGIRIIDLR
jgi:chaperone LolA